MKDQWSNKYQAPNGRFWEVWDLGFRVWISEAAEAVKIAFTRNRPPKLKPQSVPRRPTRRRLLSSSFLGLPCRILNIDYKKGATSGPVEKGKDLRAKVLSWYLLVSGLV